MTKLFKNRAFAAVISIVIIALALLFGVHRGVTREVAKLETMFYGGVPDTKQNYTKPSIAAQLEKCAEAARGIVSVAANYPETETWRNRVHDAREKWLNTELDVETRTVYAGQMREAFVGLHDALKSQNLTERDRTNTEEYAKSFYLAADYADALGDEYNALVRKLHNSSIALRGAVKKAQYVAQTTTEWGTGERNPLSSSYFGDGTVTSWTTKWN
ncbi:MAG: hypothetical protein LBN30_11010 [Oscillospiraceae bacterium]|jgi:hypothetical protein|nr:hypothetical protein [Oscillospiraceae bacterium]